jgi:hypothetical protein
VPLPAYDDYDGVHETRRFVHLPPVHVHAHETQSVARCESLGANVNYYKVLSIVVGRRFISLGVARRGSAHAVIQPMARRRRRTEFNELLSSNADQGLSRRDAVAAGDH